VGACQQHRLLQRPAAREAQRRCTTPLQMPSAHPMITGRDSDTPRVDLTAGGQKHLVSTSQAGTFCWNRESGGGAERGSASGAPEASTTSSPEDPEFAEGMLLTPPDDNTMPAAVAARGQEGPAVAAKQRDERVPSEVRWCTGCGCYREHLQKHRYRGREQGQEQGPAPALAVAAREKGFSQLLGEVMMGVRSPPPPGGTQPGLRQKVKTFGSGIWGCTTTAGPKEGEGKPGVVSQSGQQSGDAVGASGGQEWRRCWEESQAE